MAGEIGFSFAASRVCYCLIRDRNSRIWNTSGGTGAFEVYATANYASFPISAVEQGSASAYYAATMPAAIPAGTYAIVAKAQVGGSPAELDATVDVGNLEWNGTALAPLSDAATSGQLGQIAPIRMARGVQLLKFPIKMVSSADHITPLVSGIISGQISRDGAAFTALQSGAFSEIGGGWYSLQALTSGDLNANSIALLFTGTGISGGSADQRDFGLILQKTSGSV